MSFFFKRLIVLVFLLANPSKEFTAQSLPVQVGKASYYANKFHGRTTASGEKYDKNKLTAAHPTLPFGTMLKVTNLANKKTVVVRVNDRGPFSKERIIDLSEAAAKQIDMISAGIATVRLESAVSTKTNEPSAKAAPGDGTYKVQVSSANITGFGVQVASYQEFYNVLLRLEELEQKGFTDTYVNAATVKGKRTFRVLIGKHASKDAALNAAKKLESKLGGKDYFVIEY